MTGGLSKSEKKARYFEKLRNLLVQYNKVIIVEADNIGSNHFQQIRQSVRPYGVIVMGKNTLMRKVIRKLALENEDLEELLPLVKGNIGLVLVKGDLSEARRKLKENRKPAAAKVGAIAPIDVFLEPGGTEMEPTMTSFFQALNIPTKINKGKVEIVQQVHLIKEGSKVGNSEATLLQKLDIQPFSYGLEITAVYDNGTVYDQKILDLTDADILAKFNRGVQRIAAIGLQVGYPTIASVPHSIIKGYKNVVAISLATDYTIKQTEKMKEYLKDPSAFAVAAPVVAAAATTSAPAASKAKEPEPEPEEEEDDDMGFGLFD
jgi:large subunit ribosomal protein LP0